ncbi:hypothetical protein B0T10DRAFT_461312 [Thelonectria olida]|uniref:Amidase domain-containing protein n=1 Tax=Thelonectria olida TaxID=1576542 RepID=A0A9P8W3K4_9HYPO|nr:hypothetical protein B0T10DRAFT_461312 [Thelonectria olida]
MMDSIAMRSHPMVPANGYGKGTPKNWSDISIVTLDPHHWCLSEDVKAAARRLGLDSYDKLKGLARKVVGPVDLMTDEFLNEHKDDVLKLIKNDFSGLLDNYIKGLQTPKDASLAELITFNEEHREVELPTGYDRQDNLEESEASANLLSPEQWHRINDKVTPAGREHGFDRVLREHEVGIILAPADSFVPDVSSFSCKTTKITDVCLQAHFNSDYPFITLPLVYLNWNGRPFGLLAIAPQFQEDLLIDVARAWQAHFPPRQPPLL